METSNVWDGLPDEPAVRNWVSWLDSAEYPVPQSNHLLVEDLLGLAAGTSRVELGEESLEHLAACARCVSTLRAMLAPPAHIPVEELWELANGKQPSQDVGFWREHLAGCGRCAAAVQEMERGVEAGRRSNDTWDPQSYHAAVPGEEPAVFTEVTCGGFYRVTFQRRKDAKFDLLTVEVLPACPTDLEGKHVVVLGADGSVAAQGTISGGTIVRTVPAELRQKHPFLIQATE